MPNLQILVCSVRQGRVGRPVADWFAAAAERHGKFSVQLIDLKEVNLPIFDEPSHPRLRKYEHEHTKAWSRTVDRADAFVFVTPEYNFGTPPALNNALNYLYQEWHYKPVGFVSYGGLAGGTRSVQMTRLSLAALKMVGLAEAVHIPYVAKMIEDGRFKAGEAQDKAASGMLDELLRWSAALQTLRA